MSEPVSSDHSQEATALAPTEAANATGSAHATDSREEFPSASLPSPEPAPAKPGSSFFARLAGNPARDWVLLFLAIQCLVTVDGFTNTYSRWAAMAAMTEDHSFRIDRYHGYTVDWAQTPDGHYYSNKPPGPALLGYPLFRVLDEISTRGATNRYERDERRFQDRTTVLHVLSVATQAIPYGLVVLLVIAALQQLGFRARTLHLAAVALLFGNTGSLFMNTYFGHGMATMFVLAMLLALVRDVPLLIGLFFGLATLCDYGAALLLLPLLWGMWRLRRLDLSRIGRFLLGGAWPAVAFAYYHLRCFGGPLQLPNKFQNPSFVDVTNDIANLWGVLRLLPRPEAVSGLLWSTERGLLYTQPWVLLCLLLLPFLLRRKSGWVKQQHAFAKWTAGFAVVGLLLLLWMNAGFGSWQGGATPGPRYLSIAFPALALAMAGIYTRAPEFWRQALVVALVASVFPFVLLFSTTALLAQPDSPLLPFFLNQLFSDRGNNLQRCLFIVLGFAWVSWRAVRSIRQSEGH